MKLIGRILLSIIVMIATGPGYAGPHNVPLISIDPNGNTIINGWGIDGQQTSIGADYTNSVAEPGANGRAGGASTVSDATAASNMTLTFSPSINPQGQVLNGNVLVIGSVVSPTGLTQSVNSTVNYSTNPKTVIIADVSGGNAIAGGIGGNGEKGGPYDPGDANTPPSDPGDGGPGGPATPAGKSTPGGTLILKFPANHTRFAMLVGVRKNGGAGADPGSNGTGGAGGDGRPEIGGTPTVVQVQTGTTQEEEDVIDPATGQAELTPVTEQVPNMIQEDEGQQPVYESDGITPKLDDDGNPLTEEKIVEIADPSGATHPQNVLNADGSVEMQKVEQLVDVPTYTPETEIIGGQPAGPPGRNGLNGNGPIVGSNPSADGNLQYQVIQADGSVITYMSRYNLQIVSYTMVTGSKNGVFEPGDSIQISNIVVKNIGAMPSPSEVPAQFIPLNGQFVIAGAAQLSSLEEFHQTEQLRCQGP